MFGGVSYTEERAESMLFSDLPMGEEKYYLYAFAEDVQKSREAGMDEHLSKPVDMDVLEQTLRKFRVTPLQINSGKTRYSRH